MQVSIPGLECSTRSMQKSTMRPCEVSMEDDVALDPLHPVRRSSNASDSISRPTSFVSSRRTKTKQDRRTNLVYTRKGRTKATRHCSPGTTASRIHGAPPPTPNRSSITNAITCETSPKLKWPSKPISMLHPSLIHSGKTFSSITMSRSTRSIPNSSGEVERTESFRRFRKTSISPSRPPVPSPPVALPHRESGRQHLLNMPRQSSSAIHSGEKRCDDIISISQIPSEPSLLKPTPASSISISTFVNQPRPLPSKPSLILSMREPINHSFFNTSHPQESVLEERSPLALLPKALQPAKNPNKSHADAGMQELAAPMNHVNTNMSASVAEEPTLKRNALERKERELRSLLWAEKLKRPKYSRNFIWKSMDSSSTPPNPSVDATEYLPPLTGIPSSEMTHTSITRLVKEKPSFFKIVTPIRADVLREYLRPHPNQLLVESVCSGFQNGFWPFANTSSHNSNIIINNQRSFDSESRRDKDETEFIRSQIRVWKGLPSPPLILAKSLTLVHFIIFLRSRPYALEQFSSNDIILA